MCDRFIKFVFVESSAKGNPATDLPSVAFASDFRERFDDFSRERFDAFKIADLFPI